MGTFKQLVGTYLDKDFGTLNDIETEAFVKKLESVTNAEINSLSEGQAYIELLSKLRQKQQRALSGIGSGFADFLKSALSVGEDGLYSNKLRFIFELIQNVDDCDFKDPEDCKLDVCFEYSSGKIILKYNEKGFTPGNVFAITGIAERFKNMSADKVEIGEKGIGFKSVFGVADSVLIQSGYFSFELRNDQITVPYPVYNRKLKYVEGTRMELRMPSQSVKRIFDLLATQYSTEDALFNKNPLLFLNKLTYLRFTFEHFRQSLEFMVSRSQVNEEKGLNVESDVSISINLKTIINGKKQSIKSQVECMRYTLPVKYDYDACASRYGASTKIAGEYGKKMLLRVVIPKPDQLSKAGKTDNFGALYSFLPTQIRLTVPMAIHAPFKLDASREFVDPQNENAWFLHTVDSLSDMLVMVYKDLAKRVRQEVVRYIPGKNKSLFNGLTNEKVECLAVRKEFFGARFINEPIFYTEDGGYRIAKEIIYYCVEKPKVVHELLRKDRFLFIPPKDVKVNQFGIAFVGTEQARLELFCVAMTNEKRMDKALKYLTEVEKWQPTDKAIQDTEFSVLTWKQINILQNYPSLMKRLNQYAVKKIKAGNSVKWSVDAPKMISVEDVIEQKFRTNEVSEQAGDYLNRVHLKCALVEGMLSEENISFFISNNVLLLSNSTETLQDGGLSAFIDFLKEIDRNDNYSLHLKINALSISLNYLDEQLDVSPSDYIKALRDSRKTLKAAFGSSGGYERYLKSIMEAGSSKRRFLNELLQNIDDCHYESNQVPEVCFRVDSKRLYVKHNEKGFTKKDVRAITAIGESTKSNLIADKEDVIGEKGVGFKMVFESVNEVAIHSGKFHFKLTRKDPIIPEEISVLEATKGTEMVFQFDEKIDQSLFSEENLISLCLSLRKLKCIIVEDQHLRIEIKDEEDCRIFRTKRKEGKKKDVKEYIFLKTKYNFRTSAVEQVELGQEDKLCSIYCYALAPDSDVLDMDYVLYTGLPTEIKLNVPMVIDAPLELTTSRENMIGDNERNKNVRKQVYNAIAQFLAQHREELRTYVYKYLKFKHLGQEYYKSEIFDNKFMNEEKFIPILEKVEFLPTWNSDVFVAPRRGGTMWMPELVDILLNKNMLQWDSSDILDLDYGDDLKVNTLHALGYREEKVSTVLKIIHDAVEKHIEDNEIRKKFYAYLKTCGVEKIKKSYDYLKTMKVIPVYSEDGKKTEYIRCKDKDIFFSREYSKSTSAYYILNEDLLNRRELEDFFGYYPKEMNRANEIYLYKEDLKKRIGILLKKDKERAYEYILKEFKSGAICKNSAIDILSFHQPLPLKNGTGDIVRRELFINKMDMGYFSGNIVLSVSVHDECKNLAIAMKDYSRLKELRYENIPTCYRAKLDADDIEDFSDSYFYNGSEILKGFMADGLISEELIQEYGLGYIEPEIDSDLYDFPSERANNNIERRIKDTCKNPEWIVSVEETRTVKKIVQNGIKRDIPIAEDRDSLLRRYAPVNARSEGKCFCQICGAVKINDYIEVNNIESDPACHWPEGKVALCLECSKWFEKLRRSSRAYQEFIDKLMATNTDSYEAITIPIGDRQIRFTQTHLAEVQAILKHQPKKNK